MSEHTAENAAPDPYDEPIFIRSHIPRLSHMHAEPVCAFPECETYLTREDMAAMRGMQCRAQYGSNPDLCYLQSNHRGAHSNRWGTTWGQPLRVTAPEVSAS